MEADKNPFPQLELFPRTMRVVHFLFDHIRSPGLSDHGNRGGGPALDRELYDQVQVEGFLYDERQGVLFDGRDEQTL